MSGALGGWGGEREPTRGQHGRPPSIETNSDDQENNNMWNDVEPEW